MLDGLAFLPPTDVSAGMTHLRTIAPALAAPLVDYFDKTYVHGHYRQGRPQLGGIRMVRIAPMYPVQTWNVHDATLNDDPRTYNVSEAWNNKYRHLIGHQHPPPPPPPPPGGGGGGGGIPRSAWPSGSSCETPVKIF
ncbi:hypothetical protein NP493_225g01012 [Ridgeia piscesae]|uniref:Uncharacterized protein n=1 Tax=Ridgeia piscesae TaxID=27915 RepID=A0AAD9UDW7_RIDPI|nr:hypothetical protein NP493_225g01012 [Ridgeia piscesae]